MGCFLGCFGGAKDQDRRRRRIKSRSPQIQRNRVQNVHQDCVKQKTITETPPINSVSELLVKPTGEEQLSPSLRKRVTFNSNVTAYERVSIQESIDSLLECNEDVGRVKKEDLEKSTSSHSLSEDDRSIISTVGSFPPNHRYYDARDSDDDEAEEYDSDSDDFDDLDNEDDYDDDCDEHINGRTENSTAKSVKEEVEKPTVKILPQDHESDSNGRDRSDSVNSVLKPIENVTQWKAAKSKGTNPMKPKENYSFNSEADKLKNENQEMAVDASLSKWLQP